MSKITSPILLDSTGRDINETLKGIRDALTAKALIDDNIVGYNSTWSSQKILEALTIEEKTTGATQVTFDSIAASPLQVKTVVSQAPIMVQLTLIGAEPDHIQRVEYLVPLNGTYYWDTGLFIMEDGTETRLEHHYLPATQGHNILMATNVDSIEVTYKTISKQGGSADYEIISGGSAKEEA